MKKLLGILVLGLLWASTSFAADPKPIDAFVWLDGKKLKIQKGRDIENPENKILIIYNHGGWGWETGWGRRRCVPRYNPLRLPARRRRL